MAEFLDGITSLDNAIGRASNYDSSVSTLLEDSGFAKNLRDMGIETAEFDIRNDAGVYNLYKNGQVLNLSKAAEWMELGDLQSSLKELGVDESISSDPVIREYSDRYRDAWSEQKGVQDKLKIDQNGRIGRKLNALMGTPTNAKELELMLDNVESLDEDVKKKFKNLKKKLYEAKKLGKKTRYGTWIKTSIFIIVGGFSADIIFTAIKNHNIALNGCWLVNNITGAKCKVKALSCGPVQQGIKYCDPNKFKTCGPTQTAKCFSKDVCVAAKGVKCTKTLPECTGSGCNPFCSSSSLHIPEGFSLKCVNLDFWGAAQDLFGEALGFSSKWLYTAMVVGIIFILFVLFK